MPLAAACSDDEGTSLVPDVRYDMVTYLGQTANGEMCFEYLGRGDSTAIRLQGTMATVPEGLTVGRRMLLHYSVLSHVSDTEWQVSIDYITTGVVLSDTLRVNTTTPITGYEMHPLRLRAIWRGGTYLNARFELEWTGKTRMMMLLADRSTVDADTVHCYLVHDLMDADSTYFWRTAYGSFFVGNLMKLPNARVMRVHVADVIRPTTECYDFTIK